jgi:hypothetical protein
MPDTIAPHEILANDVFDHLTKHAHNDSTSGFNVYACSETGNAAVLFRAGILPGYAKVRAQVLTTWARMLTDAGFAAVVDYDDTAKSEPVANWVHVTGRLTRPATHDLEKEA